MPGTLNSCGGGCSHQRHDRHGELPQLEDRSLLPSELTTLGFLERAYPAYRGAHWYRSGTEYYFLLLLIFFSSFFPRKMLQSTTSQAFI